MNEKLHFSFLLTAVFTLFMSVSLFAQSTAGPIEITSFAGSDDIMAGDNFAETFSPGDVINVQGAYGNIGAATAAWVTYDVYKPDWSGTSYSLQQFIANDTTGVLDGNINFDYVLAEDAALFGQFNDSTDVNNIRPAFHIIQVRVAYEPAEDTFWNIFIEVNDEGTSSTISPILQGLNIYPNPASKEIMINTESGAEMNVQVYNLSGQLVLERTMRGNSLDISGLDSGFHIIRVEQDGKVGGQKLMIK
ncbi:MAG: T9SS type A sorting domain-containing protein [Bacteroidota bacterium]